jgi:hypothetical protein
MRIGMAAVISAILAGGASAQTLDLGDLAVGGNGSGAAPEGLGIQVRTGRRLPPTRWGGDTRGPGFVALDGTGSSTDIPAVDGVFFADRLSPINTLGETFVFPDTGGGHWDAIRNAASVFQTDGGELTPIRLADQPLVDRRGIGIHSNGGITYDLDAIRARGVTIESVQGVAGLSLESEGIDARIEMFILIDGALVYRETFQGLSIHATPFSFPLSEDDRFLTFAVTDFNGIDTSDHGAFADAVLVVPEPSSLAGWLAALAGLAARRKPLF